MDPWRFDCPRRQRSPICVRLPVYEIPLLIFPRKTNPVHSRTAGGPHQSSSSRCRAPAHCPPAERSLNSPLGQRHADEMLDGELLFRKVHANEPIFWLDHNKKRATKEVPQSESATTRERRNGKTAKDQDTNPTAETSPKPKQRHRTKQNCDFFKEVAAQAAQYCRRQLDRIRAFQGHRFAVRSAVWSPDGQQLRRRCFRC